MLAKDLLMKELIRVNPKSGFPYFGGQRVLITGVATMKRFIRDLYKIIGSQRAFEILTRLGYDTGLAGGLALKDMYEFTKPEEIVNSFQFVLPMTGMAKEIQTKIKYDPQKNIFNYSGKWINSFESLLWNLNETKDSKNPMCHMLSGLASGYFSAMVGRDILVKELSCKSQGNDCCCFEGRPLEEWGEDRNYFHKIIGGESLDEELASLKNKLEHSQVFLEKQRKEIERLKLKSKESAAANHGIIYRSTQMAKLIEMAEIAAPNDSTILIQGDSGTGKEVIAQYIHKCSNRSEAPFLAINCAAIPSNLIESELFGHTKGAFTGADKNKAGLFIEAGKGTIFLDEIGELAFDVQAKLLRALQQKEVMPLGSLKKVPIKARTIAATNQDLQQMVKQGKFRNDLFYRIAVFPLFITPLRERPEDILVLARHFLSRLKNDHPGFTPEAVRKMQQYQWPGNIRELENCVEYACILSKNEQIQPSHLPLSMDTEKESPISDLSADFPSPKELVRRYARYVVNYADGNKTKAAQIMGVSPPTLWRYLKEDRS